MKTFIYFLFFFFCSSASAGWIKLNQNQAMDTAYFIDLENIRGGFEKLRIWTLTDYSNIQVVKKINYQSVKSLVEINCQSKKMRILAYSLHKSPNASGNAIFNKNVALEWSKIKPNSINEAYQAIACQEALTKNN